MTIPGFTSTGSKRPQALFGTEEGVPRWVTRAEGCRVWDEAGREYLDTIMALGAVALGYGDPAVAEAVTRAVRQGGVGPLAPMLEPRVAERLVARLPGVEAVRFFKTGAEAVAAAVRVARVVTGRERVITCGYHGWLDWCQAARGVPEPVRALRTEIPFNDLAAFDAAWTDGGPVGAVVVEPVIERMPELAWLRRLRDVTARGGAVLVFDEIKTAFRVELGGIAALTGIVPDLLVVGKALGNGLPIAAVGGRGEIMRAFGDTWVSSTLATEWVSLAAAEAVIEAFEDRAVVEGLAAAGRRLLGAFEALARRYPAVVTGVRGIPQMCYLAFATAEHSAQVARAAARRGLLFKRTAYNFVSGAHDTAALAGIEERLEAAVAEVAAC